MVLRGEIMNICIDLILLEGYCMGIYLNKWSGELQLEIKEGCVHGLLNKGIS